MSDTITDWVKLAKGSHRLWPQPDEQTVIGHIEVSHGGTEDTPGWSPAEWLVWHREVGHGTPGAQHTHEGDLDTERILNETIARLPEDWQWFYAGRDEGLLPEQVQKIFDSPDGDNDVIDEVEDNTGDYRHQRLMELLRDAVPDGEEWEAIRADESRWDQLQEAAWDRDESDIVGDLARGTNGLYVRYRLGDNPGDYEDLRPNSWNWNKREIYNAARRLAKIAGLPWRTHLDQMRDLVMNATYGGELFVFWYADVHTLVNAAIKAHGSDTKFTITWENPTLLVLDYYNGSGHEIRLDGTYTRPFDPTRLVVDSEGVGYGWDKICGLVSRPYAIPCTIKEADPTT